ncbi:MAG TPA: NmrA family NAD(P)-binding protein, partial [Thermoanaerobaculia bacterium]|nr:NmrA family NAD(P)-binding protein [Thermoanaerobaculia bacterium]
MANVFVTGGTGYIGQRLIPELLDRGHAVRALVRDGSERKLPAGAVAVRGN